MSLNHGSQELEYLEKSAALGNIHGKVGLARYYLAHCPDDRERMRAAVRLMQEAQAGGARLDDKQLLQMAIAAGEYETALAARTRLAEGGDRDEQFNLGCRYESGRGPDARRPGAGLALVQQGRGAGPPRRLQQPGRFAAPGAGPSKG